MCGGLLLKVTRPEPPPLVLDASLVQVLLGALLAEPATLGDVGTTHPTNQPQLHLGRPWLRS